MENRILKNKATGLRMTNAACPSTTSISQSGNCIFSCRMKMTDRLWYHLTNPAIQTSEVKIKIELGIAESANSWSSMWICEGSFSSWSLMTMQQTRLYLVFLWNSKEKCSFILRAIWLIFAAQTILESYHLAISSDDITAICSTISQDIQIKKTQKTQPTKTTHTHFSFQL